MDKTSILNIVTFNANGLGNHEKRKDVFEYLRNKRYDIILLQETHFVSTSENFIRSCWGYDCFVVGEHTNKGGVAILINNTFEYKILNCVKSNNNCYIILDIELCGKRISLVNVYGPSDRDNLDFFDTLFEEIKNFGNDDIIIGGDWNVILNPTLDTRNYVGSVNKPRSRKKILDTMSELDLLDVFRHVYPNKQSYTWRRFNSIQQGRLDYFLLSESLLSLVRGTDIVSGYRSDHRIVTLSIKKNIVQERSRSYWKFNNSLLHDKNYVDLVKQCILDVKKQYALPIYNLDNLNEICNDSIQFIIDDQLFFEILLLEIRGKTISFASYKKKTEILEEKSLIEEIEFLESKHDLDEPNRVKLEEKKSKLEILRHKKLQGMMIRSRFNWIDKGEKPSKYFCNLEKRNFVSKQMSCLETDDGNVIFDNKKIIEETKNFFEKLYSRKDVDHVNLNNVIQNDNKLNDREKESIEGPISYQEAHAVLRNMKNDKSPGSDGYTVEFFKFFFLDIGQFLVRSMNHAFSIGTLSVTQRQGVITCIPKEGKDRRFIKNWRPISLLNVSYKIVSACIADRIKSFLPKLIHSDQKGFMSGRFIGENVRLLYDLLAYTEKEQKPGLLMLVDFEKAFDSISWVFIDTVLKYLNFGPCIQKWIQVFYSNISSCINVNGLYSSYFPIGRGVRQGDPLSPYLYLLCAEILSIMIRENDTIKGIDINNQEFLLSQFADDTALSLDGSEESFNEAVRVLTSFALVSGLKINFEKNSSYMDWFMSKLQCTLS